MVATTKKYKWVWYFIFALIIMGTVSMFSPAGKIISFVKNKINNLKSKIKNKSGYIFKNKNISFYYIKYCLQMFEWS